MHSISSASSASASAARAASSARARAPRPALGIPRHGCAASAPTARSRAPCSSSFSRKALARSPSRPWPKGPAWRRPRSTAGTRTPTTCCATSRSPWASRSISADSTPRSTGLRGVLKCIVDCFDEELGLKAIGVVLSSSNDYLANLAERVVTPAQQRFADFIGRGVSSGAFRGDVSPCRSCSRRSSDR